MKLNGEKVTLSEETTLANLLRSKGYAPDKIAVELNGEIVPRNKYASVILTEADVLEVVCFVGGG